MQPLPRYVPAVRRYRNPYPCRLMLVTDTTFPRLYAIAGERPVCQQPLPALLSPALLTTRPKSQVQGTDLGRTLLDQLVEHHV